MLPRRATAAHLTPVKSCAPPCDYGYYSENSSPLFPQIQASIQHPASESVA